MENINDYDLTWSEYNVRAYEDIPIEETDNDSLTAQLKLGNDTIEDVFNDEVKPVLNRHTALTRFDQDLKDAGVEEDKEASADVIKNNVNSEIVTR